jgi:enoyl-CoA hydratase/carnithine racemase
MGGLMSITGKPGYGPMRAGIPVADLSAGLLCALGILVALRKLEAFVKACAETIAGNAPLTLHAAKFIVNEIRKDPAARDLARCDALVAECFASRDYVEGRTAFMEKRKPRFTGR